MKPDSSRQGFTLIELLIATVVIATLMGVVFRLAGVGSDSRARARTIDRLQRIENALSGYYAAYGSYPPVPLQGRSRSIYRKVDSCNLQSSSDSNEKKITDGWGSIGKQVEAACRAQPIAVYFPFNKDRSDNKEMLSALSAAREESLKFIESPGQLDLESDDWNKCSLFQFGLLSFLLPRYLFMLDGHTQFYDEKKGKPLRTGAWAAHNQLPCNMKNGDQYEDWASLQQALGMGEGNLSGTKSDGGASMISNLTSQSVCARWMPNFERIISGGRVFYGVNTEDGDMPYLTANKDQLMAIHSFNGYNDGGSGGTKYLLDGMTIRDGWGREFYYYSEPPYQSYRLWSAGPDGMTFPVWYNLRELSQKERNTVKDWIADDISSLNN